MSLSKFPICSYMLCIFTIRDINILVIIILIILFVNSNICVISEPHLLVDFSLDVFFFPWFLMCFIGLGWMLDILCLIVVSARIKSEKQNISRDLLWRSGLYDCESWLGMPIIKRAVHQERYVETHGYNLKLQSILSIYSSLRDALTWLLKALQLIAIGPPSLSRIISFT